MNNFISSTKSLFVGLATVFGFASISHAQSNPKSYFECNHDSLITVLRAYEDSLALSTSTTVVRVDYAWRVTDVAVGGKVYKIYRCEALYDSLEVLREEVAFARMTPPTVDTDSIGGITGTGATFYGKVTSDGDTAVTAQWFKYGLSASSLTDSLAVSGVATPFSAVVSGLTAGSTYYVAAFAMNVKGTSPGDTLSFTTHAAPTVDTDAASSVTSSAATLNATITATGGTAITATGFKYATNSALSSPSDAAGSGTSSPFTASLTGLAASTQYWAVGYATNSVGTSYGDTITFTTSAASAPSSGFVTCGDSVSYDGYMYPTVLIGSQCWFKENLRNDNYNDGSAIPGNLDNSTWTTTNAGAQTVYDEGGGSEATNLATYGRLYNWYAVTDAAGLCPTGWHVPTDAEWTALETHLGANAGDQLKAAAPTWDGTNSSGFSALPGGGRYGDFGHFSSLGFGGLWWSSSSPSVSSAWYRYLLFTDSNVGRIDYDVRTGFSVRCLQDPPTAPTVDTDAATSVTETTATLNATITATGGAAVTATGFKYGTDAGLTSPTDIAGSGTSSPFTASLTGLTASTQYWAVGYATNSVGTSYGDTITFTTSAAAAFSCGTSTVTYDGHAYTTVLIGSQCWFKENLRNDNYNDGSAIPGNLDNSTWTTTNAGAQTVYDQGGGSEATNLATYGRLYNWYAVTDAAGLCPTGWHVPTDAEWTALETHLGGSSVAGDAMKSSSSDSPAWDGTNSSGFSALPGGGRDFSNGNFDYLGYFGLWWSSSPSGSDAWGRYLNSGSSDVNRNNLKVRNGFSVRCLLDPPTAPTVDTDAATSVTETTATLNATIPATGGAAVTATGFKYGTDAGLTSPTDIAGSGTSSPFTASLTGLTASTQYWAVGYATNSVGTSYGDTITFTTSAAAAFTCGTSTVTYDGHAYTTVLIGSQCWFKENLRNDKYNDGTTIPGNLDNSTWSTTTSGAQTVYNQGGSSEATNLTTFGRLYNWYAVSDAAGLCPTGWHVPTDAEWTTLATQLGGSSVAGDAMKSSSTDSPPWEGTNSSGFSALPGGLRGEYNGNFGDLWSYGYWWSSSPSGLNAWLRYLESGNSGVNQTIGSVGDGYSVRCLQDPPTAPTVDTDAASSVTSSAATLNANITSAGGAAVSATGFKYGTDAALTSPSDIAGSGSSSPFTASLTGLTASTQYWAVGYATNSAGTSYGDTITFTTSSPPFACGTSTVTYDGHAYTTVLIGSQCWFKENLRNDNYKDGTAIPGNLTASAWSTTTSGAQTVYDEGGANEATNLATYGRLYNWYAVNDAAGLCPTGWHVPTDAEWTTLETQLGGSSVAGDAMKSSSTDSPPWDGTNSSGFSALPGGFRNYSSGYFGSLGAFGRWWSSSPSGSNARDCSLYSADSGVYRDPYYVRAGFSVRCVQD